MVLRSRESELLLISVQTPLNFEDLILSLANRPWKRFLDPVKLWRHHVDRDRPRLIASALWSSGLDLFGGL